MQYSLYRAGTKTHQVTTPVVQAFMGFKSVLSVALNGARRQKSENPAVPISPKEIAAAAIESAKAGAAIALIHARLADGTATQEPAVYAEIIKRIGDQSDIIVQVSIGGLGFSIEELLKPLVIEPEMASFPLRVLNEADADRLADLRSMASRMKAHGVRPELDASSLPMLHGALALHGESAFVAPLCFGFVLKEVDEMSDGAARLLAFQKNIPKESHWWAMKGGQHSLGIAALALSLGGHARTGFEDTVRDPLTGELATSNAHLVADLAELSCKLGRDPASPKEAREMLSLRK